MSFNIVDNMNMEKTTTDVEAALTAVASAKLTPTEHLLLKAFVNEAVDPSYAAQHILQRLNEHSDLTSEEVLRVFKEDWRRLVVKCESPYAFFTYVSMASYLIICQSALSLRYPRKRRPPFTIGTGRIAAC